MRKTTTALAVCGAALSLAAASAVAAQPPKPPKAPHTQGGTVSLVAPSPALGATSTTASGNVFSQASCRKNRTVHLTTTKADGTSAGPEVIVTTGPNGDYTSPITLPANVAPTTSTPYTLTATVDQAVRKSGKGKHKGKAKGKRNRVHICGALTSAPVTVTVTSTPAP
jgi:hypothetical protein